MRTAITSLAVLLALLAQAAGQEKKATEDSQHKEFSLWMVVKVEESQKVFAALARADFDAISRSTEKLKTVSALEGFVRRSTPGYRTQLRSFEFAVDEIQEQAKRENIEGVTMGFHQLTLSCVNCHKQLRRPAQAETTPPVSESSKPKQ